MNPEEPLSTVLKIIARERALRAEHMGRPPASAQDCMDQNTYAVLILDRVQKEIVHALKPKPREFYLIIQANGVIYGTAMKNKESAMAARDRSGIQPTMEIRCFREVTEDHP